jgi:hypothetical protein
VLGKPVHSSSGYLQALHRAPQYFVALMASLQFRDADLMPLEALRDDEWRELLTFGDLAHLTLPATYAIEEVAPGWVVSRIRQNIIDNAQRLINIKLAYKEIAEKLEVRRLDHLMIKGFTQYPSFGAREEFRFQSDIDLYCPSERIMEVSQALADLGYIENATLKGFPSDHLPIMARKTGWTWRGNMYDPEMPPSVDLHFCLWNASETHIALNSVDEFWDRKVVRQANGFQFPTLTTIDNLGYCALHILRDLFRNDWVIHHVYEIAWFLHHHAEDEELWKQWVGLHDIPLRSLEVIAFWLAQKWFSCDVSPVLAAEMLRIQPLPDAWLEKVSMSPLTGMFRPNKDGVWLHHSLVSSKKDKRAVLRNGLMPTRIPALNAPGQNTNKSRRIRRFWPKQPHLKYIIHIIFRIAFHIQLLTPALLRGIKLWRARAPKSSHVVG